MAKSKINMKYKPKKRERKNTINVSSTENQTKSIIITIVVTVGFIAIIYLGALGLEKIGVFEEGYTKPTTETEMSYTDILIGETFNRPDHEYIVLFDTFGDKTNDVYVKYLAEKYTALNIYYVDMSGAPNNKYVSETSNPNAKNVSDLKINGVTLVKIKGGRITKYITGNDSVAEFFK